MDVQDIRKMDQENLLKEMEEGHKELMALRFGVATRQLNDTSQIGKIRKKIARLSTVIREREILGQDNNGKN